jgi:hypothetical protein
VRPQEHRRFVWTLGSSPLSGIKLCWKKNEGRIDNRLNGVSMALSRMNLKEARVWRIKGASAQLWYYGCQGVAEKAWNNLLDWIL